MKVMKAMKLHCQWPPRDNLEALTVTAHRSYFTHIYTLTWKKSKLIPVRSSATRAKTERSLST
jgi:hypothetical protein